MPATSQEVKQVLIKWGVDTSDWKKALSDITRQIGEVRKSDAAARSEEKEWLESRMKQIRLSIGDIRSEVNERVKATRQVMNQVEQQKLLSAQATTTKLQHQAATAALQQQKTQQQAVTAAAAATAAQHKTVTAQIQAQNAALRLQITQQKAAAGFGGGGGGRRGGGGTFLGGLLGGGGFMGALTGAVAMGEVFGSMIEGLIAKMRAFIESSGPLQQVREQFEKLSAMKGIDAVKFLNDMRTATHNLVNDVELYRTANKFMQSGVKATEQQMVALTQATVGLARAQGRDATQAINALNQGLATGRFMALGRITGLQREDLAVRGLSATMSDAARKQAEFDKAFAAITGRFQQFGEPAITVTEAIKQFDVATTRLFQSFAQGVATSRGMAEVFKFLQEVIEELTSGTGGVEALGQKFGDVFIAIVQGLRAVQSIASSVGSTLKTLTAPFTGTALENLVTFSGLMKTIAQGFVLVSSGAEMSAIVVKGAFQEMAIQAKILKAGTFGDVKKVEALLAESKKNVDDANKQFIAAGEAGLDRLEGLEATFAKPGKALELGGTGTGTQKDEENFALKRQLMQLELKLSDDKAKQLLAIQKLNLQDEKDANEESYKAGLESLADYVAKKKVYRQMELQDTLNEIQSERDAKLKELQQQKAMSSLDPKAFSVSVASLDVETETKRIQAKAQAKKEEDALDRQNDVDRQRATEDRAKIELETRQSSIQEQAKLLESAEKNGDITVQQYVQKRIELYQQELEVFNQLEEAKYKAGEKTQVALTQLQIAEAKKREDIQGKIASLQDDSGKMQMQQAAIQLEGQLKLLEAQKAMTEIPGAAKKSFPLGTENQTKATEALIAQYEKMIAVYSQMMASGQFTGDDFLKLADKIGQANAQIVKLQGSLMTFSGFMGTALGQMADALSSFNLKEQVQHYDIAKKAFTPSFTPIATQFRDAFAATSKLMEQQDAFSKWAQSAGLGGTKAKTPMDDIHEQLQQTFSTLSSGVGTAKTTVDSFSSALNAAISTIQNFVSSLIKGPQVVSGDSTLSPMQPTSSETYNSLNSILLNTPSTVYETMLEQIGAASSILPVTSRTGAGTSTIPPMIAAPSSVGIPATGGSATSAQSPDSILSGLISSLKTAITAALSPAASSSGSSVKLTPTVSATLPTAVTAGGISPVVASSIIPGSPSQTGAFSATDPLSVLGKSIQSLASGTGDATTNLQNFTKALTGTIGTIGTFVSAMQGQGGPLVAGLTGASSGSSLGQGLGSLAGSIATAAGSALGTVLPGIGQAAGAVIGGVVGIFSGKAQEAAKQIAQTITENVTAVMKQYATQTQTLSQTIASLQAQERSAISQLSGKKGGRQQLDQILPQIDQQITQLQEQQTQIMHQMEENMQIVSSPLPWQSLLQNISSVIDQYKQYIDAGGNVVTANQFLTDSFANLQTTNLATLNQDEQDAINNALQYNDLLLQRQQYLAQTDQQIQDIMASGAPSRMRTTAQTKMAQIEQIELARNTQLQQMNEQITVAGYRLTAEQQIFNLAQDRVGLETQLAQLQMQTINQDVARIAALQSLVTQMSGSGSSVLIAAIMAALAQSPTSSTAGLAALLAALGLTPSTVGSSVPSVNPGSAGGGGGGGGTATKSGGGTTPVAGTGTALESAFQAIYASRGRQGFGGFNGELG